MLNEWIEINPSLKDLGCDLGESHPSFRLCPNKKGFKIYLDKNGNVEDIEIADFEKEKVYRWQEGKKDPAFPVFNARALWEVTCDPSQVPEWITKILKDKGIKRTKDSGIGDSEVDYKDKGQINEFELKDFLNKCNDLWEKERDLPWIQRCLKELPTERQIVLESSGEKPDGYKAYKSLVERAYLCQPNKMRDEIRIVIMQKLQNTRKKEYVEALFAFKKEGKKKGRGSEHQKDFLYLLTIKDWDNPEYGENRYPPYHHTLQSWMARTFEKHSNKILEPIGNKDAFGNDMAGARNTFDDINVGLGQIKLFSANEDIPCLKRYGLVGSDLFQAGHISRELARKTLEYILSKERKGITWISLRKYENRSSIAFAYCTKLKDVNAIKIFENDDQNQEDIYVTEEATKTALKTFEGIAESEPAAEIIIGIVVAVDRGNTKVLASRHYSLNHYMSGAIRWQAGCVNIPELILPQLNLIFNVEQIVKGDVNSKKERIYRSLSGALPVYPTRAIWLLNSAWRQNGEMITRKQGNQKVPLSKCFSSSDALDFLFEEDTIIRERVDAGLESIIETSAQALITAKLKADLDHYKKGDNVNFRDSEYLHMLPTLYGLLLHKKGILKEDYMAEEIFYLGRLFAAVDKLHIQYSLDVRNGDVPLQLIGNDHMSVALQNPLEAFVSLGRRLEHPYISWAKRVNTETIPRQAAKNCLEEIAELTNKLTENPIPTEINDADKAKLILGYLSYGAQKKTNSSDINPENKKGKEAADHE